MKQNQKQHIQWKRSRTRWRRKGRTNAVIRGLATNVIPRRAATEQKLTFLHLLLFRLFLVLGRLQVPTLCLLLSCPPFCKVVPPYFNNALQGSTVPSSSHDSPAIPPPPTSTPYPEMAAPLS
ncbi:hypothetical protein GOP47_0016094 [Adiantum capillus-veneris]|uniref:Uncharacterized protein n=1 Tax=Adiantum capillus-veneris TaxID=13818 RepID=A0A9D4UKV9_ADICA|nr:hypothetical protein GOP47_0016094 [Adiantum capillus-veneris]